MSTRTPAPPKTHAPETHAPETQAPQSRREQSQQIVVLGPGEQRRRAMADYIRQHSYADKAQWTLLTSAIAAVDKSRAVPQLIVRDLSRSEAAPFKDQIRLLHGRALTNEEDPGREPLRDRSRRQAACQMLSAAELLELQAETRQMRALPEEEYLRRVEFMHRRGNLPEALRARQADLQDAFDILGYECGPEGTPEDAVSSALRALYQRFESEETPQTPVLDDLENEPVFRAIDALISLPRLSGSDARSYVEYGPDRYGVPGENGRPRLNLLKTPVTIVDENARQGQAHAASATRALSGSA